LTGLLVSVADRQLRGLTFWTLGALAGATGTQAHSRARSA
jgi:ABC-type Fe3+-siderophore transport system permease subunit